MAMLIAGGVDGGDGGGAARARSRISPASLEKRRSAGIALQATMVARGHGVARDGVMAAAVPFTNGVTAVVAKPVAGGVDAASTALNGGVVRVEDPMTGGMVASTTGTQLEDPTMSGHGGWYGATP